MRTVRTHYEILGVSRDATLAHIKRAYRLLVRKYHPDVARDKQVAHRLFLQINQAYEVLSDPVQRRAYDESLERERTRTQAQTHARAQAASSTRGASRTSGPGAPQSGHAPTAAQHIKDAQWSFIQRRLHDAARHCKEALRIDPRNARAYAILGDIYRAQGKVNSAVRAYSYAVQYNPRDMESERKLMDLVQESVAVEHRPEPMPAGPATRTMLTAIWWSVAFLLILMIWVQPGEPIAWLAQYVPWVSKWSWNLVVLMSAASVVVGILLCVSGLVKHPDQELVFENTGDNWAAIPTGIMLLIGSGFSFLAAAGFYVVAGFAQGSISKSVLTSFVAVLGVVLLCSAVYDTEGRRQVLLFGGNVSFLSMLVGWYIGSMLLPLSER